MGRGLEPVQLDPRNEGNALLMLKEMQPSFHQERPQFVDGVDGESAFAFPSESDDFQEARFADPPGHGAGQLHPVDSGYELVQMLRPNMFFQLGAIHENLRLGIEHAGVFRDFAF